MYIRRLRLRRTAQTRGVDWQKVDIRFIGDGSLIADAARDGIFRFGMWAPKWRDISVF